MDSEPKYFALSLDSLRVIGAWAADCAERALPLYERQPASDTRPRAAIEGIRRFADDGKRTARLRTLALDAHAAAREIGDPAATAAARAAGIAAATAYTHPLADVQQTKHVVGAAAYAALALELDCGGDPSIGEAEVRLAIEHAPCEAREVLQQMPARQPGKSRLDTILYELDAGIRAAGARYAIREATASDLERVLEVERLAFGKDDVAELVRDLVGDPTSKPSLSLLAWDGDRAVGHIMFTAARVQGSPDITVSILAPLAVVPESQRKGIGARLIEEGLRRLKESGADLVFVLGHPSYYPRHGFEPAGRLGFAAPYPISPEDAWMVQALRPGIIGRARGTIACAEALDRPEHWRE